MPTFSERAKNDRARQPVEHATVTSQDVPGTGMAKKAATAIEGRKERNRKALEEAMKVPR